MERLSIELYTRLCRRSALVPDNPRVLRRRTIFFSPHIETERKKEFLFFFAPTNSAAAAGLFHRVLLRTLKFTRIRFSEGVYDSGG